MKIENISVSNINLTDNSAKLSFTLKELTKNVTVYLKINDGEYVSIFTNKTNSVLTYNLTNLRRGVNTLFLKLISTDEEYISEPIDVKVKNNASVNNLNCSYSDSTGKYILDFTLLGDAFLKYKISINIDNVGYKQILEGQIMGDKSYEGSGLSLGSHKCKIKANDGYDEYESSEYSFEVKNHKPYLSDIAITDIKNSGTCTVCYGVKDIETSSLTHSIVIDGTKKTITPTKTNDFYTYAVTGLGVGKHTMYVSISDKTDIVNSSTVTIELFQSSTNTKRLLEIAKLRYDFSYQQLKRIIETTISDGIFNYETENDVILKSQTYYKEMYAEFNRITLTSIDKIGNTKITKAKSDLNKEIDDVYGAIDTLENTMETTFKDGVLSDSEKDTLRNSLNLVAKEKVDIDKDYTNLYNNKDLTGTPKTNLKSTYDTFVGSHNTLVTTVNNLINKSGIVDNTDKTNLDTAFTNWRTALGNYRDASMNAIDAIARKKVDDSAEVTNKYWSEIILEEGGIQSRVGSLETKVTGTGGIDERLRSAEQKITTDGITNLIKDKYYTKEVVDNKLAEANVEFEIGGRNLLPNTDETTIYSGTNEDGGWSYFDIFARHTTVNVTDTEYIVSFDAKADNNIDIKCFFYSPNTTTNSISSTGQGTVSNDGHCLVSITTEWKRYWVKWKQTPADSKKGVIVGRNETNTRAYIRAVKLEKGTKATDWTPAPEDIEAEIETTKESVAEHTTALNNITSRVSTTESNITKINGNITSVTERISTAEQKITDSAITSTVSKNFYTKEQVDAIEIGGRNLISNSAPTDLTGWSELEGWTLSLVDCTASPKGKAVRETVSTANSSGGMYKPPISKDKLINGETYTISAWIRASKSLIINFKNELMTPENNINVTTAWKYFTFTSKIDTSKQYYSDIFYINNTADATVGTWIEVHSLKLEKGTKATDWTPAPEDTQTQIENLNSTITQTANSWSAKITQNEKDIASLKLTDSNFEVAIGNKADSSNIISKINASTEGITISSSKINISGYVTFSALSTSGSTSINGGNITSGVIRGIKIISSTSDSVSRGELSGSGLNFYSPSKLAGTIYFDSNGEGTTQSAKDRFLITSKNSYVLKLLSAGNMSLQANSNIYLMGSLVQTNCQLSTDGNKITCGALSCGAITNSSMSCSGAASVGSTLSVSGKISASGQIVGHGGSTEIGYASTYANHGGTKSRYYLKLGSFLMQMDTTYGFLFTSGSGYYVPVMASEVFANGVNLTSDERLKTDIKYVNKDEQTVNPMGLVSPNVNITTSDMHEFIETLPMVSYRLVDELNKSIDNTHYGFLAQEILYTKVGSELITVEKDEYGNEVEGAYLRYSQDKYISFICGALQEEIKQRKQLEQKVLELEQKLGDDK